MGYSVSLELQNRQYPLQSKRRDLQYLTGRLTVWLIDWLAAWLTGWMLLVSNGYIIWIQGYAARERIQPMLSRVCTCVFVCTCACLCVTESGLVATVTIATLLDELVTLPLMLPPLSIQFYWTDHYLARFTHTEHHEMGNSIGRKQTPRQGPATNTFSSKRSGSGNNVSHPECLWSPGLFSSKGFD